jgi:hypothetical protein
MSKVESLSLAVRIDEIPADGRAIRIEAGDDERRALAEQLGIPEVAAFTAELNVRPLGGGAFSVSGQVRASVVQTDIVTLDPVEQQLNESIDLRLVPEDGIARVSATAPLQSEPAEGPETYRGGRIELGALAAEHLALGLDPYPRAPGVEFTGYSEDDSLPPSPFAALAGLKKDRK